MTIFASNEPPVLDEINAVKQRIRKKMETAAREAASLVIAYRAWLATNDSLSMKLKLTAPIPRDVLVIAAEILIQRGWQLEFEDGQEIESVRLTPTEPRTSPHSFR